MISPGIDEKIFDEIFDVYKFFNQKSESLTRSYRFPDLGPTGNMVTYWARLFMAVAWVVFLTTDVMIAGSILGVQLIFGTEILFFFC